MAAPRLVIELAIADKDVTKLTAIARSRTEPASRVERARMLLAYREGRLLGVHHQTAQRCIERAAALGPLAALDDSVRPGKTATITAEAKAWLISLACQKAKDFGYPHELVDDAALGLPCARTWAGRRARMPRQIGARDPMQNSRRTCHEAAQDTLLPGAPGSRIRREDGARPLYLP